jgi:hypothetical protein
LRVCNGVGICDSPNKCTCLNTFYSGHLCEDSTNMVIFFTIIIILFLIVFVILTLIIVLVVSLIVITFLVISIRNNKKETQGKNIY